MISETKNPPKEGEVISRSAAVPIAEIKTSLIPITFALRNLKGEEPKFIPIEFSSENPTTKLGKYYST